MESNLSNEFELRSTDNYGTPAGGHGIKIVNGRISEGVKPEPNCAMNRVLQDSSLIQVYNIV
jgi:hypothetical protein